MSPILGMFIVLGIANGAAWVYSKLRGRRK